MRDLMQPSIESLREQNRRAALRRKPCDELTVPGDITSRCRHTPIATDGEITACAKHRYKVFYDGGVSISLWTARKGESKV